MTGMPPLACLPAAPAVADALDSRLRGNPLPQRTVIPYRLIERDSVGGRHSVP